MTPMIWSEIRDPAEVRRGEIENMRILTVIQALRRVKLSDEQIAEEISKQFGLILPYARNYVREYDREARKKILPWQILDSEEGTNAV